MAVFRLLAPLATLALFSVRSGAITPDVWVKGGSGNAAVCAGAKKTCTTAQECTFHAVGPCGGALTKPDMYISSEIECVSLLMSDQYLSDPTKIHTAKISPKATIGGVRNGWQVKSADKKGPGGATYALSGAGAWFGEDPSTKGFFLGMVAYLVKTGSISTNKVPLQIPKEIGSRDTVEKLVCISDRTTAGGCGSDRTFTAAAYKFSLYGYTTGLNFTVDDNVTYLGIRTRVSLVGATAPKMIINGNKTLDDIGSADVTMIELFGQGGSGRNISIDFPTKYNYGDISNTMKPGATKDVKIKVSRVPNATASEIYIDYLFEALKAKDKYFIYDPTVTELEGSSGTTTTEAGNTISEAALSKVTNLAFVCPPIAALLAAFLPF